MNLDQDTLLMLTTFGRDIEHQGTKFKALLDITPVIVDDDFGEGINQPPNDIISLVARTVDVRNFNAGTELTIKDEGTFEIYETRRDATGLSTLFLERQNA